MGNAERGVDTQWEERGKRGCVAGEGDPGMHGKRVQGTKTRRLLGKEGLGKGRSERNVGDGAQGYCYRGVYMRARHGMIATKQRLSLRHN